MVMLFSSFHVHFGIVRKNAEKKKNFRHNFLQYFNQFQKLFNATISEPINNNYYSSTFYIIIKSPSNLKSKI